MGDSCIHLVPQAPIDIPQAEEAAHRALTWFLELGIVEPTLSDCILSDRRGYRFTSKVQDILDFPDVLATGLQAFGLEIHFGSRKVFHTVEGTTTFEFTCPSCKFDQGWDSMNGIELWLQHKLNEIECPNCTRTSPIQNYHTNPLWGFSNLGFTLWNFSYADNIRTDFLNSLAQIIGHKILAIDVNI